MQSIFRFVLSLPLKYLSQLFPLPYFHCNHPGLPGLPSPLTWKITISPYLASTWRRQWEKARFHFVWCPGIKYYHSRLFMLPSGISPKVTVLKMANSWLTSLPNPCASVAGTFHPFSSRPCVHPSSTGCPGTFSSRCDTYPPTSWFHLVSANSSSSFIRQDKSLHARKAFPKHLSVAGYSNKYSTGKGSVRVKESWQVLPMSLTLWWWLPRMLSRFPRQSASLAGRAESTVTVVPAVEGMHAFCSKCMTYSPFLPHTLGV